MASLRACCPPTDPLPRSFSNERIIKMKVSLIALALAAALPLSAQADALKYNYIEADYASTHAFSTTLDGYKVKGSAAFGDGFYGTADYSRVSKNGGHLEEGTVGVGYRHA